MILDLLVLLCQKHISAREILLNHEKSWDLNTSYRSLSWNIAIHIDYLFEWINVFSALPAEFKI